MLWLHALIDEPPQLQLADLIPHAANDVAMFAASDAAGDPGFVVIPGVPGLVCHGPTILRDASRERRAHLFIPLHRSALPFSSFAVLQFEDALPLSHRTAFP